MIASLALALAVFAPGSDTVMKHFEGTYAEAVAKAKAEKKTVFIDFYTDWCGWCKELDKRTFTDAAVIEHMNGYVNLKINAEKGEGPDVAKRFGVEGYPTLLLVDGEGEEIDRIGGFLPADKFLKTMKEFQAGETFQSLQRLHAKNPSDAKLTLALAKKWRERGDSGKAKTMLDGLVAKDADNKSDLTIDARRELAILAFESEENVEALKEFAKKFPAAKHSLEAHRILAQVLAQSEELESAIVSFEFVQANQPADPEWMNHYAWFLAENHRNLDRALELASKAVALSPKAPQMIDTLAEVHFQRKEFAKAIEWQKKAIALLDHPKAKAAYEERLKMFEDAAKETK